MLKFYLFFRGLIYLTMFITLNLLFPHHASWALLLLDFLIKIIQQMSMCYFHYFLAELVCYIFYFMSEKILFMIFQFDILYYLLIFSYFIIHFMKAIAHLFIFVLVWHFLSEGRLDNFLNKISLTILKLL